MSKTALLIINKMLNYNDIFFHRTRTPSGSNTPVHPDQQTAVSKLLRRGSGASDTPTGHTRKKSLTDREPFRL